MPRENRSLLGRRRRDKETVTSSQTRLPGGLSHRSLFLLGEIESVSGSVERIFRLSENRSLWHKLIDSFADRGA